MYLLIFLSIWISVLTFSVIYAISADVPVFSRTGCIYYRAIEYCESDVGLLCRESSLVCLFHHITSIIVSFFYIFLFSSIAFITLRIYIYSWEAQYRDANLNYYLSTRRAIDSQLVQSNSRFEIV